MHPTPHPPGGAALGRGGAPTPQQAKKPHTVTEQFRLQTDSDTDIRHTAPRTTHAQGRAIWRGPGAGLLLTHVTRQGLRFGVFEIEGLPEDPDKRGPQDLPLVGGRFLSLTIRVPPGTTEYHSSLGGNATWQNYVTVKMYNNCCVIAIAHLAAARRRIIGITGRILGAISAFAFAGGHLLTLVVAILPIFVAQSEM
jgi:hypothetical protein